MEITDDKNRIIELGRRIMAEKPELYSSELMEDWWELVREYYEDKKAFEDHFYSAVYCSEVYGTTIEEYGIFNFINKTHEEKLQYITRGNRYEYLDFLNRKSDTHLLCNKYTTYQLLKPFYKRDAMLLSDENDYDTFCAFAQKHKSIFVKPVSSSRAEGVHCITIDEATDISEVFSSLLFEARHMTSKETVGEIIHKLILEEKIIPSTEIAQFNPFDMSVLRVTTILIDGAVQFFYPCFRIMLGDGTTKCGEMYSLVALIDADTGIVTTEGVQCFYGKHAYHPVTGIKIKGFAMPEWEQLKSMLRSAARLFPTVRYIGWDVVYSVRGWCIIEGNSAGEFFSQGCIGHGVRDEFCSLIGYPEKNN